MSVRIAAQPAERVRHFSQLLVWQKAHQLFLEVAQAFESAQRSRAAWVIEDQVLRSDQGTKPKTGSTRCGT